MNRILFAVAPFLLVGCAMPLDNEGFRAPGISSTPDSLPSSDSYAPTTEDESPDYPPDFMDAGTPENQWIAAPVGSLTGQLPTVGKMTEVPAVVNMWADTWSLNINIEHIRDDGSFGLLMGSLYLDEPLAPGQVLEPGNILGCSGPQTGTYDYDEPASGGVVVVDENDAGELVITFDLDYASNTNGSDHHVIGVATMEPYGE